MRRSVASVRPFKESTLLPSSSEDTAQSSSPDPESKRTLKDRLKTTKDFVSVRTMGVLVAAIVAMAAMFLSEHYGGPVLLFAL